MEDGWWIPSTIKFLIFECVHVTTTLYGYVNYTLSSSDPPTAIKIKLLVIN